MTFINKPFRERQQPSLNIRETYGIVLDFLQHGRADDLSRRTIAQIIGTNQLVLLEVAPKKGVFLEPLEKVYIGIDKRDKIHHITKRLEYDELTETAKISLDALIKEAVESQLSKIIEFFNKAGPISMRQHQLELIPGIGKKHMWAVVEEREKRPFSSIDDLKERVPQLTDIKKSFIKRIIEEFEGVDKYKVVIPLFNLNNIQGKV